MSSNINKEWLYRQWVHAYEEDTPTVAFYRPVGDKLPHSRGRTGFELKPDRTVATLSVGSPDKPQETAGLWEIEEGNLPTIRILLDTGETQKLPIISLEEDRLVVRKCET